LFSQDERRYCELQARPEEHYAARFAAKEAFLKALGRGVFGGIPLREIEVRRAARGKPFLRLGSNAKRALRESGAASALLSLTHDGPVAVAFVVLR
jgi:holo-[acyl-carrier protein] synthase